jgi:hypothetical protein
VLLLFLLRLFALAIEFLQHLGLGDSFMDLE